MDLFETRSAYDQQKIAKPDYILQMFEHHKKLFEYSRFIPATDIAAIEIRDEHIILTSRENGIKMRCDLPDRRIPPMEILNFGQYERRYATVLTRLIKPGFCIVDIGANVGWYSILFARMSAGGRVISFEPVERTYKALRCNLDLNQVKNVTAHQLGLSNENGNVCFYVNPEESIINSLRDISQAESIVKVLCPVRRLDEVLEENHVDRVDFIKCDVEGGEFLVFQGAVKTLREHKPIVFAEMLRKWSARFDYHPNQMISFFGDLGYDCFNVKDQGLERFISMDESTVENNFFFLHRDKHRACIADMLVLKGA